VSTLIEAGYVTSAKGNVGSRRTTWIALTRHGRQAVRRHLCALQELIEASASQ
jgi:DNA-binding MarR family transcriptional regulator